MGLNSRIIHYGEQQNLWSKFLMLLPLLFISCGVQKTNPYELNYQELHPTITMANQNNKKQFLQLVRKQLEYSKDLIALLSKDSDHPDMIKHKGYYNGVIQLLEN